MTRINPAGLRSTRHPSRREAILSLAASMGGGFSAFAGLPPSLAVAQSLRSIPILVYHRFDPTLTGSTTETTAAFRAQLAWLAQHRYRVVTLSAALAELNGTGPRPPAGPAAVITADDGHESIYTQMFPLVRQYRAPVTLFIYPAVISEAPEALTWAQLDEMEASGLADVQSHTYSHPNFRTERQRRTPADYEAFVDAELRRSKAILEARTGKPVTLLAWPYGIVDPELEAAAKRAGYSAAFAFNGGPAKPGDDPFALPRVPVADSDRGERFGARLDGNDKSDRLDAL